MLSNNASTLQVAIKEDAQESNMITGKECVMAQSSMKALNKNKYYIPMDYTDAKLQIDAYKDVLIEILGLHHLQ